MTLKAKLDDRDCLAEEEDKFEELSVVDLPKVTGGWNEDEDEEDEEEEMDEIVVYGERDDDDDDDDWDWGDDDDDDYGDTDDEEDEDHDDDNGGDENDSPESVAAENNINIKNGVDISNMSDEMIAALDEIAQAWADNTDNTVTITSGNEGYDGDGVHSDGSLHYEGDAVDLRTRDLDADEIDDVADALRDSLGDDYDVIVESDHIHVEYDPEE